MSIPSRILIAGALALLLVAPVLAADATLTMTEDGSAFVYRARPGDQPGTVAAMFGIGVNDLPAFLAANGITDPTRVGVGHVYRVPNPLAARAVEAEAKAAALERDASELRTRSNALAAELATARADAVETESREERLAHLERLRVVVTLVGILLVLATIAVGAFAATAIRKTDVTERHARSLADDLEEKRRAALADRQVAARTILDLENKVRDLELKVSAAAPTPVRRSPAGTG